MLNEVWFLKELAVEKRACRHWGGKKYHDRSWHNVGEIHVWKLQRAVRKASWENWAYLAR